MDRVIVDPSAIVLDTDILSTNKSAMVGLGLALADILGTSTCISGLACAPTIPASLAVIVGAGRIYSLQSADTTAFGSLPADAHQIVKQGILADAATLVCRPPGTAGQSINYLIEASYRDSDGGQAVVPYYNSANPTQPFQGPLNNGLAQPTLRQGLVTLQAKAGVAAVTGTQTTPAADAGFVGLYIVTVANGQGAIPAGHISVVSGAPFMGLSLGTRTVTGPSAGQALTVISGNSATSGTGDLLVTRPGSTANLVGGGASVLLGDSANGSDSLIQNAGGQTEFWQFNAGVWRQWAKVSANLGVTLNAPISGPTLALAGNSNSIGFSYTGDGTTLAMSTAPLGAGGFFGTQSNHELGIITNNTPRFYVSAAGGLFAAGLVDEGIGAINANAFFLGNVNLVTTVETFATTAANAAQAAAQTYANGTATAEGWKAPGGGLIVKGGVATMIASAPGTLVTFGTAFPNACLSVVITAFGGNATVAVLDKSTTGFHGINGAGTQCTWMAIGT